MQPEQLVDLIKLLVEASCSFQIVTNFEVILQMNLSLTEIFKA